MILLWLKIISYYFHVTIATTIILKMEWNTSCGISIFHMLKKARGCCMHVFLVKSKARHKNATRL